MGAVNSPRADGHGRADHRVDLEQVERDTGRSDIDNRIESTDLMKMNGFGGHAVHCCLSFRQIAKGCGSPRFCGVRNSTAFDDRQNVRQ